jgi:hypothetical protein
MFAIITCYHVFTSSRDYYGQSLFTDELSLESKESTDTVLNDWYENRGFGHDISDPFSFPHIKYFGKLNLGRDKLLLILSAMSIIIDVFSRNREQLRSKRKLGKLL